MPGLLERIVEPRLRASSASEERMWSSWGANSAAGINVTPETALTYSSFYACVSVLAEDESTLPLPAFERRGDMRIARADHAVHHLLNVRPNERQTAQEFREWMTAVCAMRGEALAEIRPGPRGFASELSPLDPNTTFKDKLPNGRVRYRYREDMKPERIILAEDVFRLPGRLGLSVVTLARLTLGSAIAGDQFTARMWQNGIRPRMGLQHPGRLSEDAQKRLAASVDQDHGGVFNAGKTIVFEEGMTWVKIGLDPKDAQFLESRQFSVEEVCRWFRMQPHKVAHLLRATFNNIEHQGIEHVTDTIRPWCVRWEQAVAAQLITEEHVFVKHNLDALLRGDALTRAQALEIQRRNGIRNANEWRAVEDLNPRTDPGGEAYWDVQPGTGSGNDAAGGKSPSRARALAEAAAQRVVQREMAALARKGAKYTDADPRANPEAFDAWRHEVEEFYGEHRGFVHTALNLGEFLAASYCDEKAAEILAGGLAVMEGWLTRDVPGLAEMALGGTE